MLRALSLFDSGVPIQIRTDSIDNGDLVFLRKEVRQITFLIKHRLDGLLAGKHMECDCSWFSVFTSCLACLFVLTFSDSPSLSI